MGCSRLAARKDEVDRYGRAIPDDEYQTKDLEKVVALRAVAQCVRSSALVATVYRRHLPV